MKNQENEKNTKNYEKEKLKAFYKMRKHYMMTSVNVFFFSKPFCFLFSHFLAT